MPEKDYCLGVCRRGDLGTRKDLELVEVFDYDEQMTSFIMSDDMHGIYTLIRIPKDAKSDYRAKIVQSTNEKTVDKWILDKTKIPSETYSKLYAADKATGLSVEPIDFMGVSDVLVSTKEFVPILDARAWVGGAVTVGSGGTYATLALTGADAGTLTSAGTATQISAVTETAAASFANDPAGYTMTLDGAKYLLSINYAGDGLTLTSINTGSVVVNRFNMKRVLAGASGTVSMIRITNTSNPSVWTIKNNVIDLNSLQGTGFRVSDNSPIVHTYNNIIMLSTDYGMLLDSSDGNANSIYENNTYYNCAAGANYNGNAGKANNESFANCGTAQTNNGSLSVDTNHVTTAAGDLLTDFDSITKTDGATFLRPKHTGSVYKGRYKSLIGGHTRHANLIPLNSAGALGAVLPRKPRTYGTGFGFGYGHSEKLYI